MTKEALVKLMNEDLVREYEHWFTYMQACTNIKGLHRLEFEEFFWEEAQDEMEHVKELSLRISGLGGTPVSNLNLKFDVVYDPVLLLHDVLQMEEEVVAIFAERIKQTEEMGGSDGMSLHVFYEDMINDSRKTVDKVKMLLSM